MSKTPKTGRPSIFRDKTQCYRVQGVLSNEGGTIFEKVRGRLVTGGRKRVSDADVIETAVRAYWQTQQQQQEAAK